MKQTATTTTTKKKTVKKNTIIEIKNTPEVINRITEAEKWISKLGDRMVEITTEEQNKGKTIKRTKDNL